MICISRRRRRRCFATEFQQIDAVKSDLSRIGLDQAKDRTAGRRLATSGLADQAEGFAAGEW